jgi:HAD superfamily hydrolase (TIGR01509 family)
MSDVKAVLFDLGNVLVDIDLGMFPQKLGFAEAKEIMYLAQDLRAWVLRYETGEFQTDIFLAGLQNILGGAYPMRQLREAFQSIVRDPVKGMEELVEQVSRATSTALVSNTNEIHHLTAKAIVPALVHLEREYVSYELKILKPAPAFYEAVIGDLQLRPDEIIFVDDTADNVAGANAAGMTGILFTNAVILRDQLRSFGVV